MNGSSGPFSRPSTRGMGGRMKQIVKREPQHIVADKVIRELLTAEKALAAASGIDQVRLIMDVGAAREVFAKRQGMGEAIIGAAHALKIHALARLGELLKAMPKAAGAIGVAGPGRGKRGNKQEPRFSNPTLADLGLTKKVSSLAQQLDELPPETREAIAQRETTFTQARRKTKAAEVRKAVSLPDAKYRVVYADPPWSYGDKADTGLSRSGVTTSAGSVQSGGTGRHYPSMSIAELCELEIKSICEPNAVLFLWVTSPLLAECWPVIKAWGFAYKSSFVWDKVKHNMGHYNSVRHELLLICTRGSCMPDEPEMVDSVQSIERTTHSTKPEEFRAIIDRLYPHGKRIELFARKETDGWDTYGNDRAVVT